MHRAISNMKDYPAPKIHCQKVRKATVDKSSSNFQVGFIVADGIKCLIIGFKICHDFPDGTGVNTMLLTIWKEWTKQTPKDLELRRYFNRSSCWL